MLSRRINADVTQPKHRLSLTFALFLSFFLAAPPLHAEPALTLDTLRDAIVKHRDKVEEFRVIREAAKELGVRVWLFGGTVADSGADIHPRIIQLVLRHRDEMILESAFGPSKKFSGPATLASDEGFRGI